MAPVPRHQILAHARRSWHRFQPRGPDVTQGGSIFGMKCAGSQGATGDNFNRMSTIPSHSGVSSGEGYFWGDEPLYKTAQEGVDDTSDTV